MLKAIRRGVLTCALLALVVLLGNPSFAGTTQSTPVHAQTITATSTATVHPANVRAYVQMRNGDLTFYVQFKLGRHWHTCGSAYAYLCGSWKFYNNGTVGFQKNKYGTETFLVGLRKYSWSTGTLEESWTGGNLSESAYYQYHHVDLYSVYAEFYVS